LHIVEKKFCPPGRGGLGIGVIIFFQYLDFTEFNPGPPFLGKAKKKYYTLSRTFWLKIQTKKIDSAKSSETRSQPPCKKCSHL